ncbi:MAG: Zn-dependent hydrolase, partial [Bacteroidetes bacterium]
DGKLKTLWYHEAFKDYVAKASDLLQKASKLAGDKEFANYLKLRSEALLTDNYQPSDLAWLDVKNNNVDLVIGPIENYTDKLFGYKAAHESYVLIKDRVWSDKLSKYATFLPQLQTELPVDPKYKKEVPGSDADLNAYDVVYYGGDCNMASKTIAINLPNDEEVQLKKGTRKLQLKNAMQAKFDNILVPISNVLIAEDQRKHITFDAFFANTMLHEVAHGMGIKNTIDGSGTVRHALKEQYSALEEGKADILGLYLVTKLNEMGEFGETDLMDNYVTFMAGIFRSVRFGLSSAHGKANMVRFNFFQEKGAFTKNADGTYAIDIDKMKSASVDLTQLILKLQGDGDYDGTKKLLAESGVIKPELQADLDRLETAGIPVDITFIQGAEVLGLK